MQSPTAASPGADPEGGRTAGLAAAANLLTEVSRLFHHPEVQDFCDRLSAIAAGGFCKSWIGLNFRGAELLSLKVYFTFYELFDALTLARILPDERMRSDFLAGLPQASTVHVADPLHPGSGYTFCLKVDRGGNPTRGFYHRVGQGEKGIFRLYGPEAHVKEYFYVTAPRARRALSRRFGIPFVAGCGTIEHGIGPGHGLGSGRQDEKIILIGDFEAVRHRLFDGEEQAMIGAVEAAYGLRAACGGVYRNGVKSFYLAAPRDEARNRVRTVEAVYRAIADGETDQGTDKERLDPWR